MRLIPLTDAREADVIGVIGDDGREYAVFLIEGKPYVTDNWCTHGQARLSEGFVLDHCIECPLHQGQFDIRTGEPLCEPVDTPIKTYPVQVDADGYLTIES
jgi:naphthalene 1,2-dioxygenase ferredoxin component